ncbi:MAG: hypothetical protein JXQ27_03210 [Acidobacteria bacterium]|nr:hypothetical protein [Acidobacteriota bacterium]
MDTVAGTRRWIAPVVGATALILIYFLPRLFVSWLGEANPWTSFLYQYGLGSVVFGVGLLVILRTRACQLQRRRDRYWFIWLWIGFFLYIVTHAVWIWFALSVPVKGGH